MSMYDVNFKVLGYERCPGVREDLHDDVLRKSQSSGVREVSGGTRIVVVVVVVEVIEVVVVLVVVVVVVLV